MSFAPDAEADHAAGIAPQIRATAPWRVVSVETLPGYRMNVRFVDGLEGAVDMRGLVSSPEAGVFAALKSEKLFAQARVVMGAVTWPGDLDLAPDAMHDEIQAHGTWVLA